MPLPPGAIGDILREMVDTHRAEVGLTDPVAAAARRMGISRTTAYDWLANPDRPRTLRTMQNVQRGYDALRPVESEGPHGSVAHSTDFWLPSHLRDLRPRPQDTAWLVNHRSEGISETRSGWASSGWMEIETFSLAKYLDDFDLSGTRVGEIRFASRTAE